MSQAFRTIQGLPSRLTPAKWRNQVPGLFRTAGRVTALASRFLLAAPAMLVATGTPLLPGSQPSAPVLRGVANQVTASRVPETPSGRSASGLPASDSATETAGAPIQSPVATVATSVTTPAARSDLLALDGNLLGTAARLEAPSGQAGLSNADLEAALAAALAEMGSIVALAAPDDHYPGSLRFLLQSARRMDSARSLDASSELVTLLQGALAICRWSQGAVTPLGGNLLQLWLPGGELRFPPSGLALATAVESANCSHLRVGPEGAPVVILADGSQPEVAGFAEGLAVDRGVEALHRAGLETGWVALGKTVRAFGAGPQGEGWAIAIEPGPGLEPERLLLHDQALAALRHDDRLIHVAGLPLGSYLDYRTGQVVTGKLAVLVVTKTGLAARGLSEAIFALDNREAIFRLNLLDPEPAVRWYLGSGNSRPLLVDRGWAGLPRWSP